MRNLKFFVAAIALMGCEAGMANPCDKCMVAYTLVNNPGGQDRDAVMISLNEQGAPATALGQALLNSMVEYAKQNREARLRVTAAPVPAREAAGPALLLKSREQLGSLGVSPEAASVKSRAVPKTLKTSAP